MKQGYTLVEMMVVVAVCLVVASATTVFFSDSWTASHRVANRIDSHHLALLLSKQWRKAISDTSPASWRIENNTLKAGALHMSAKGSHLVVQKNGTQREYLLPDGAACKFTVESEGDLPPCAVLEISWKSRYFRKSADKKVRLAACGGQL